MEKAIFRWPEAAQGYMMSLKAIHVAWGGLWPPERSLGSLWPHKICYYLKQGLQITQDVNSRALLGWLYEEPLSTVEMIKSITILICHMPILLSTNNNQMAVLMSSMNIWTGLCEHSSYMHMLIIIRGIWLLLTTLRRAAVVVSIYSPIHVSI